MRHSRRVLAGVMSVCLLIAATATSAWALTIIGTPGNDRIHGSHGDDRIDAGAGDDRVHARRGNDTVRGEQGADRLHGGRGNDDLNGLAGPDLVRGGPGNDVVRGDDPLVGDRVSRDVLRGGRGDDEVLGGDGSDRLRGGLGTDTIRGEAGDDRIGARDGVRDYVVCGPGQDVARLDRLDTIQDATADAPRGSCETVRRPRR